MLLERCQESTAHQNMIMFSSESCHYVSSSAKSCPNKKLLPQSRHYPTPPSSFPPPRACLCRACRLPVPIRTSSQHVARFSKKILPRALTLARFRSLPARSLSLHHPRAVPSYCATCTHGTERLVSPPPPPRPRLRLIAPDASTACRNCLSSKYCLCTTWCW